MRKPSLVIAVSVAAAVMIGCAGGGRVPPDEALARLQAGYGRGEKDETFRALGPGADPSLWKRAAERYYPPAHLDYFRDMDWIGTTDRPGARHLELTPEAVKGRNAWVIWSAGNEAWWDWLARYGYGTIDLLRLVDHAGRETRFARTGLINEPGTREPTDQETEEAFGVRYARPGTPQMPAPGGKVHVEYRKDVPGWAPADPDVYGYPSGVVGLRLYPNPAFTNSRAAQERWKKNLNLYYADTPEARKYTSHPDTVRPFRVGMSCGFCHIAPHPLNPPADAEAPEWTNLSNNVGNQFMRIRAAFGNMLKPDNYLYHVFDSQLPGAVDTSGYPSDNSNNPNTINSFYGVPGRLDRARNIPRETVGPDTLAYIRKYETPGFQNPNHVPRVLLDGADSVGVDIALSRVYLNIGTHHQQWLRVQNPLLGFRRQDPFKLADIAGNSLSWHATLLRIQPMVEFFVSSTNPQRLKDVARPADPARRAELEELLRRHLRGTGLPWYAAPAEATKDPKQPEPPKGPDAPKPPDSKPPEPKKAEPDKGPPVVGGTGDYAKGRAAFAKGCVACHSSVQPGDLIDLEQKLTPGGRIPPLGELPADWDTRPGSAGDRERGLAAALAPRRALRLTADDRARLTRGDGQLPEAYRQWAAAAVNHPEFWEYPAKVRDKDGNVLKKPDGTDRTVTVHNFLSIDERIPVTITRTNSARAAATNALHGSVWEDFASQTYKELAPVGPVRYRDPFSGAEKTYAPPGGGPGYYRVPTLISIWATAPFLHNNSLGLFNNDPSAGGRLQAFDDAIGRLLWPERRATPSPQWYWDGAKPPGFLSDAWYSGYGPPQQVTAAEAARRAAGDQSATRSRAADGGWIWRTNAESWLEFQGPHVPQLVGGVFGLSDFWRRVLPWAPALAFLVLGTLFLLSRNLISFRERYLSWLWWLLGVVWWVLAVVGLIGAGAVAYLVVRYWPMVMLLDVGTRGSIWGFRVLAVVLPLAFFLLVGLLFTLYRFSDRARPRVARLAGAAALVLAVLAAVSVGPFLAGYGAGVRLGPIPEGTPINTIASIDPGATFPQKLEVLGKLSDFFLKHKGVTPGASPADKEARRVEFEAAAGPALLNASKCPDYVTDRGHDYEFIRQLTDEEKTELIALLKTF